MHRKMHRQIPPVNTQVNTQPSDIQEKGTQVLETPNDDERNEVAQGMSRTISQTALQLDLVPNLVQNPVNERETKREPITSDNVEFQLDIHNAASDVGKACSMLDPECESCQ